MKRKDLIENLIKDIITLRKKEDLHKEMWELFNARIFDETSENIPILYLEELYIRIEERLLLEI